MARLDRGVRPAVRHHPDGVRTAANRSIEDYARDGIFCFPGHLLCFRPRPAFSTRETERGSTGSARLVSERQLKSALVPSVGVSTQAPRIYLLSFFHAGALDTAAPGK